MSTDLTKPAAREASSLHVPAVLSAWWLGLAAVEAILVVTVDETAWNDPALPLAERLALVACELAVLAVAVLALGGPLALALERWGRRAVGAFAVTLVALALLELLAVSWGLFATAAHFLDGPVAAMAFGDGVQVVQHAATMAPHALVLVPLLVAVAAVLGCVALPRWLARHAALVRGLVRVAAALGLACAAGLVLALLGPARSTAVVTAASSGAETTRAQRHARARDGRSGPMLHLAASLRPARELQWSGGEEFRVVRRPLIPMERYVEIARAAPVPPKEWNVIVVLVESLRPDQLRAFGGTRDVMPNVDALAREARIYTDCTAQATFSIYADPCVVSSHYPLRSRGYLRYQPGLTYPRVMFYDVLAAMGRKAAIFSSQNEYWGGMYYLLESDSLDKFFHAETYDGPTYVSTQDPGFASWVKGQKRAGKIIDAVTVDAAIQWIDEVSPRPFCFTMNLQQSHVPYELPAGFPHRFGPEDPGFTVSFSFPRDKVDVVRDLYADSLFYVDTQLGRLFAHLRERGLWEETVVIVTGDNGEAFYEHDAAAHAGPLYQESLHVPLIVRAPGLTPGADDRPAQHVDVPPTICAVLGLPTHPSFQGRSLLDANPAPDRSRYAIVQLPFEQQFAVTKSGWKLVYDSMTGEAVLYDLKRDPGETVDALPANRALGEALGHRLATWYTVQLEYYEDVTRHGIEYPPIVAD